MINCRVLLTYLPIIKKLKKKKPVPYGSVMDENGFHARPFFVGVYYNLEICNSGVGKPLPARRHVVWRGKQFPLCTSLI
jgi:hypothetical protein